MTLHTRAATDEIYDLFNQPLKGAEDEEDEDGDSDDEEDMTDGDYTSGGESTGTGRLLTSEAGDDETSHAGDDVTSTSQVYDETTDVKSVSEWSEFTGRKHIPTIDDDENDDTRGTDGDDEDLEPIELPSRRTQDENDELVTPVSPCLPPNSRTMFVPIPPEDYEPPTRPYRDASQVSQNRLPFMTPIAEKTESSLGMQTNRGEKDYFSSKTPSKENGSRKPPVRPTDLGSSPFREIVNEAIPEKIAQPLLGKTSKIIASKSQPTKGPLAKEIVSKGPIVKEGQCNPVDDYIRNMILENIQPPLSTYEGYFEQIDETKSRGAEIKKFAKAMAKKTANEKTNTISMPPVLQFPGTKKQYMLKKELGAGAFAPVYLIENVAEDDDSDANRAMTTSSKLVRKKLEALKMEDPPTAWEFYIMRQAKRRLGISRAAESVITAHEMHLYPEECFLIEDFRDQGTLLEIINIARADSATPGGVMDETLVMFFAIELLRTVEALHSKGILHGDLKADNCLVRLDQLSDSDVWSSKFRKDGTSGWDKKGIALIDFGRGIDMNAFRTDVQFIADWKTGPQDCAEMRELRPWTYQIDYHGLAGILHSMLFGKYIDTVADKGAGIGAAANKKWRIKEGLKRYWQTEIWGEAFDLLLNPSLHMEAEDGGRMPVLRGMKQVRESMEVWLEANSERGVGLQALIRKLEWAIKEKRR